MYRALINLHVFDLIIFSPWAYKVCCRSLHSTELLLLTEYII